MHPIHVASSKVFEIGGVPISDTILMSWLVMTILIGVSILATRQMTLVPSGLQNLVESIVEAIFNFVRDFMGHEKHARVVFGFSATILLFILFHNWMGLIPGVGSIGIKQETGHEISVTTQSEHEDSSLTALKPSENFEESAVENPEGSHGAGEHSTSASSESHEKNSSNESGHEQEHLVYLLRPASSDLSFTIGMALLTILYVQAMGIYFGGAGYLKKFFNFSHPIKFFVGLLEIISEISRVISLAFRLFGNIFAGKVLLIVMIFLVPYLIPVPFYGIELFVGGIQALVFFILTLVFLKGASEAHH
jgi:F-type H+-transporting ATPase subunit a